MHKLARSLLCVAALVSPTAQAAMLFHHYDFNGNAVTDLVNSMNGTLIDGANVSGGVLNLDGNGDFVQFANHLIPIAGSYSFALFARRDSNANGFTEVISQGSSGAGHYLGTDPAGNIRAGDQWGFTGVPFGAVGSMTHYAVVVDAGASSSQLFVNGALAAQMPFALTSTPGGTDTRLGAQFAPFAEFFHGVIDDLRIYDGVLTPLEVAQLAAPVPEPAGWALLLSGGLALGAIIRRHGNHRLPDRLHRPR